MADDGKELSHRQRFRNWFKGDQSPEPTKASDSVSESPQAVPKVPSAPVTHTAPPPSESVPQQDIPQPKKEPEPKRNLSKEAFDKLPAETQDEVRKLLPSAGLEANEFSSSAKDELGALVNIVQTKQTECEKKFWKINIAGNDIVVKEYVYSTLAVLQGVGDIAINFAPAPGSIVWSGVKTMMQMYVDSDAQLCALLMVAQSVTPVLCRVQAYEPVFTISNNTKPADLEQLNNAAIEVYRTCFKILAYTSGELGSKLRRARHALLGSTALNDMMSSLKALQTEHERCVNLCQASSTSENLQQVREGLGSLSAMLEENQKMLKSIGAGVDLLVSQANLDILKWISPVTYGDDHERMSERRAPGTAEWLVEHPVFKEWENSSSGLFWLEGTVGVGKSVLSSSVIDHFFKDFHAAPEDGGFAYFYCNRGAADHRDALSILGSYVRQLSTTYRSQNEMRPELRAAVKQSQGESKKNLERSTCEKQILGSINLYPRTVLVVDGLDECEKNERKTLFGILNQVIALPNAKVFIASRPTEDLKKAFDWEKNFRADASDNTKDVEAYVNQKLEEHDDWDDEDVPPETRSLIKTRLLAEKDGRRPMFRWVSLQLEQLFECSSAPDIMDRLGRLPPDLDESYNEIWEGNTGKQGANAKALVEQFLSWTLAADPQPASDVLIQVFRYTTDGKQGNGLSKKTVLDLCQHLLVIDSKSDRWQFTHASVAEWFESHYKTLAQARCHVAKVCISHLLALDESPPLHLPGTMGDENMDDLEKRTIQWRIEEHFHRYWPVYIKALNDDEAYDSELVELLKKFLRSPMESSEQYQRWVFWVIRACQINEWPYPLYVFTANLHPPKIALFAMVAYGFTKILKEWWDSADMNTSVWTSDGNNLLTLAASAEVMKLLVKRGIDVNAVSEPWGNALCLVIYARQFDLVKMLVECGAEVNEWTYEYAKFTCPLQAAIDEPDLEILQWLVEHAGMDVNKQFLTTKMSASALGETSQKGLMDVVKYLVDEAKADVNMKIEYGHFRTALEAAEYGKHAEVIEFLKSRGAKSSSEDVVEGTENPAEDSGKDVKEPAEGTAGECAEEPS